MSKYIFGPVPSRRLGRSLGVDLVPMKTCSYDCIYCQLGKTTCKTTERKEWVPLEDVLAELEGKLHSEPDYITLSGSGEPTLYSRCDELIDRIKATTDVPVAVLTNGSLLWQDEVRRQLMNADLVIPSLDAGDEAMYRLVNRPHEDLSFEKMLSGLIEFRREFRGQYWLELLMVGAFTVIKDAVDKLVECVDIIAPDRVQLNTVTRPPAENFAIGISQNQLNKLAGMFNPPAQVIADFQGTHEQLEFAAGREDVLNLLRRRPCSTEDIADGLGMHRNEVVKHIEYLSQQGQLLQTQTAGRLYYRAEE
ncbi:MAG: radical SAM protein [Pirellulales bacterium]|nr:radical SAM protein [Pirellulales bacterium]